MKENKVKKIPVCPVKVCIHLLPLQSFKVVSLEPKSRWNTNEPHKFIVKEIVRSMHLNLMYPVPTTNKN